MKSSDIKKIKKYMIKKWGAFNFHKETINTIMDNICDDVYRKYPTLDIDEIRDVLKKILKERPNHYYLVNYR